MDDTLTINRLASSFVLPQERQAQATTSLLALALGGKGIYPYQEGAPVPLEHLLAQIWRCSVAVDLRTGAIRRLFCGGAPAKKRPWDLLFNALAPAVTAGGYIVCVSNTPAGRRICEYHFDGQRAHSIAYAWSPSLDLLGAARTAALSSQVGRKARQTIRSHYSADVRFCYEPQEARRWLTENLNPTCFASNTFGHKDLALRYVEALYRLGARQVCVTQVFDRMCDILVDGGPYADSLSVHLPEDPTQAQVVRDFCLYDTPNRDGKEVFSYVTGNWWEEAIPDDGWIGITWD